MKRRSWIVGLVVVLGLGIAGCGKKPAKKSVAGKKAATKPTVGKKKKGPVAKGQQGAAKKTVEKAAVVDGKKAPANLAAVISVRAPGKIIDKGLELAKQFSPDLRLNRQLVMAMLMQKGKAPPALVQALDLDGDMWLAALDPGAQKDAPVLAAIPIKDKAAVEKLMSSSLKKIKSEGTLTQYLGKKSGAKPFWVEMLDNHVLMGSNVDVFKTVGPYMKTTLLGQKPRADLEITAMLQNIGELQRNLDGVVRMAMLKAAANPQFEKTAAGAAEGWLKDIVGLLKSASSLSFSFDIAESGVQLAIHMGAKDGSPLHARIKRTQPGAPFGHDLFPANTPFLTASAGNAVGTGMIELFKKELEKSLPPQQAAQIGSLISELESSLSQTYTTGIYRNENNAFVLLNVIKAKDGAKAVAAVNNGLKLFRNLIKAKDGAAGLKKLDQLGIKSAALTHAKMSGRSHRIDLGRGKLVPADKVAAMKKMGLKGKAGLAYAGAGDRVVLCLTIGDDVNAELKRVLDGKRKKLSDAPAFKRMLARSDRTMWLYLSAVDVVRALGTVPALKPIADKLASVHVASALTLDWGVNDARDEYNGRLDIPVQHLLHFKPLLPMLGKR